MPTPPDTSPGGTGGGGGGGASGEEGRSRTPNERYRSLMTRFRAAFPGIWETLSKEQQARVRTMARETAHKQQLSPKDFLKNVRDFKFVASYVPPSTDPEEPPVDPEEPEEPEEPTEEDPEGEDTTIDQTILDILSSFLSDNLLPQSLMGFIQEGLAQKKSYAQIIAELRQTPEYKAAYPENDIRIGNGYEWLSEAEIRATRSELRRLADEYIGVKNVSQEELNQWIGTGKSVRLFEQKLQRFQEFERWGPTVRSVLELELGYSVDDERLFAFFDETSTPELDAAYERALIRGQPAILGLGVRPEEEAELLRRYGIAPEQAFRGYQDIARELPVTQRFGLIEAEINRNLPQFPTGTELFTDTPFATLFRAIQLGEGDAIRKLQSTMARETARFQGQGGAAQNQAGQSIGLLSEDERARLQG